MTYIKTPLKYFFLSILITTLSLACSSDKLPEFEPDECAGLSPTYTNGIKDIIDSSCAYAGCHDGQGGIGPGDYNDFEVIRGTLESGSFQSRVIDQRDNPISGMPPNQSVYPESMKDDLTDDELLLIRCWINDGFPQ